MARVKKEKLNPDVFLDVKAVKDCLPGQLWLFWEQDDDNADWVRVDHEPDGALVATDSAENAESVVGYYHNIAARPDVKAVRVL